jgi:SAM-dependent methyltransferase
MYMNHQQTNLLTTRHAYLAWQQTAMGEWVQQAENAQLRTWLGRSFGKIGLHLGQATPELWQASGIQQVLNVEMDLRQRNPQADIITDFMTLPFLSQSIDCICAPHALDFSPQPLLLLAEMQRVLSADGQLFLTGFNPHSWWNWHPRWRKKIRLFNAQQQLGVPIKNIMAQSSACSMIMRSGCFIAYRPPFLTGDQLAYWAFLEQAGNRWLPNAGAVYALHLQKRTHSLHLIQPNWSLATQPPFALAKESARKKICQMKQS